MRLSVCVYQGGLRSRDCAYDHWHKRLQGLLQFLGRRGRDTSALLHLPALPPSRAMLLASSPPLPAHSPASAARGFQSRNNFCCIFTNAGAMVKPAMVSGLCMKTQRRMKNWQGAKGEIVLSSSKHFLPSGMWKQGIAAFLLCSPQHPSRLLWWEEVQRTVRAHHRAQQGTAWPCSSLCIFSWSRRLLQPAHPYMRESRLHLFMCLLLSSTSLRKE